MKNKTLFSAQETGTYTDLIEGFREGLSCSYLRTHKRGRNKLYKKEQRLFCQLCKRLSATPTQTATPHTTKPLCVLSGIPKNNLQDIRNINERPAWQAAETI